MGRKWLMVVWLTILFSGCGKEPFFEFDQADHYHISLSEDDLQKLDQANNDQKAQLKKGIIFEDFPENVADTFFIKNLKAMGFIKKEIPNQKLTVMHDLFKENSTFVREVARCEPEFKDIVVFRNKSKIAGIAKLCFECDKHWIVGSRVSIEDFGQHGEFEALKKLLD